MTFCTLVGMLLVDFVPVESAALGTVLVVVLEDTL